MAIKVSKTARASAVQKLQEEKSDLTPEQMIQEIRNLRAAVPPGYVPGHLIDALLVAHDKLKTQVDSTLVLLNEHLKERTYVDLDDAIRNLLQAYVTMRDNATIAVSLSVALPELPEDGKPRDDIVATEGNLILREAVLDGRPVEADSV
jgi:hypothetical protein